MTEIELTPEENKKRDWLSELNHLDDKIHEKRKSAISIHYSIMLLENHMGALEFEAKRLEEEKKRLLEEIGV
ncbi:MAG TPA: hypothetical protein VN455_10670 [Methanotrichaceae archaeon]|nr:hypothetical protein [Methanotrichaceae archaeon]